LRQALGICQFIPDIPFQAGAYLSMGEVHAVIDVRVGRPGVVKKAIDRAFEANSDLDLG
jgi:uncharacterized protein (UPF0210 family)